MVGRQYKGWIILDNFSHNSQKKNGIFHILIQGFIFNVNFDLTLQLDQAEEKDGKERKGKLIITKIIEPVGIISIKRQRLEKNLEWWTIKNKT